MESFVLRGHVCHSLNPDRIEITERGYLVAEAGVCMGVFRSLPPVFSRLPLKDCGDRLIIPGMTDLHLHAPQYAFRGLGMNLELLDWLHTYTFPEEAKYRDLAYADRAYRQFVRRLTQSATTRAAIFGTVHRPATQLLMDLLEDSGLICYVGKVNMDRNCPEELRETDPRQAAADTEAWIQSSLDRYVRTRPILTPRFLPACSDELMLQLKQLQRKYSLPTQSHLSENLKEIQMVRSLAPHARCYGDAYRQFGLFGGDHPCIMAHCVHSGEEELELIRENGVYIAHSPESNMNLSSGVAPVSRFLELGLRVGLATDLAGGSHENMFRAMMHAIQASKLRWRLLDQTVKPLSPEQAFYLATLGGGSFFGKVGCFREGYELDALVLDDTDLETPAPLSVRSRLERMIYLADSRNIAAKYVAGRCIFEKNTCNFQQFHVE